MSSIKSIIFPVVCGRDFMEAATPFAIESESKKAVFHALRARGYRVMHKGGLFEEGIMTKEELLSSHCDDARVFEAARALAGRLDDETEVTTFTVTVYPMK